MCVCAPLNSISKSINQIESCSINIFSLFIQDDWPDMNLFFTSGSTPSDPQIKNAHGLAEDFYNEFYKELEYKDVYGIFPMMLRPRSRKCIIHQQSKLCINLISMQIYTIFLSFCVLSRWFHKNNFEKSITLPIIVSQLFNPSG